MSAVGSASVSTHRADIQGLRGIAVLLVVAYHADLGLPGGFLGVDAFFVISGFVIGRVLRRELDDSGSIRLRHFYARRVRRLLPALSLFLTVTMVIVALTLTPDDMQHSAFETALAAQAFVSNVYLYRHVGYFDSSSALNPFLHLWSLSVEEQIYLLIPPLLAVVCRRSAARRTGRALNVLVVVGVGSLALALAMTWGGLTLGLEVPDRFVHFAAPTRAWEFCAGAILAFSWHRVVGIGRSIATVLGVVGVAALVVAVTWVQPLGPFPAVVTMLAVGGSVALLVAGAVPNPVSTVVSWRPLTVLGDWSYAWYLWHWPAIVVARMWWPSASWPPLLAAVIALAPAAASSIWVERPLRVGVMSRSHVIRVAAFGAIVPLVASAVMFVGLRSSWGVTMPEDWNDVPPAGMAGCVLFNRDIANTWADECDTDLPGATGTVLVLGDQQADAVHAVAAAAGAELRLDAAVWARSECPFLGRTPLDYPRCEEWNRNALELVDELDPEVVVIANNSPAYVDPSSSTVLSATGGDRPENRTEAISLWRAGLDDVLDELGRRGIPVIVVAAVPDFGVDFPRDRVSVLRPRIVVPELSLAQVAGLQADVIAAEASVVAAHQTATILDPIPVLCTDTCTPVRDGRWWYTGPSLLSTRGALQLTDAMIAALREVRD